MDKKRVFNAAVTAGLSLSMVLTSVPATALANVNDGEVTKIEGSSPAKPSKVVMYDTLNSSWVNTLSGDMVDYWYGDATTVYGLSHEGYVFAGWTTDWNWDGSEEALLDADSLDGNSGEVSVYAQWKKVESEEPAAKPSKVVMYDTLNSSWVNTLSGDMVDYWYGDATTVYGLSHEGYVFAGWTTDWNWDGSEEALLDADSLDGNSGEVSVYAQWKKVESEDPAAKPSAVVLLDTLDSGWSTTLKDDMVDYWYADASVYGLSHEGYEFAGWTLDWNWDGSEEALLDADSLDGNSGEVSVYAQWKKVESEDPEPTSKVTMVYRDSLNADWAGQTSYGIDNDVWYFDPTGTVGFVHPGYKFVGWSYDQAGTDMLDESSRPLSADPITVWAQWEQIELGDVTVTYKDSLDPEAIGTTSYDIPSDLWYVDPVAMNMFAHPGYEFVGWSYDQEGTDMLAQNATPSGDMVIWAQWKKVESPEVGDVTVTYKDSLDPEADGSKAYDIPSDSWYVDPTETGMFDHYGYKFVGWSYNQDGTDPIDPSAQPTGDMVIWAQWEQIELGDVTVTYKDSLDPEAAGSKSYDIPSDSWYVDPSEVGMFTHPGYKFVGWSYNQDGTDPIDPSAQPTGDMVIWAQWEAVEMTDVTVTYKDALDPENPGSKSYDVPSNLWYVDPVATGMFSHDGYEFVGWSYNQDGTDPLSPTDMPAGDMVIWAQWKKIDEPVVTHTVTFVDKYNGTQSTVTVENGDAVIAPVDPSYPGFTFVGWSTDGFEYISYDFSTPVTGDLVLYASYSKNAEPSTPGDDQPSTPAPGDEVSPEQAASDSKKEDSNVPETGDATNAVAVTGIGIAGLMAAAASFILRRRNEQ